MKETTYLKTRLVECENPVGKKKTSNWVLPPVGFVYGKKEKEDKEGVSISNFPLIFSYQIMAYSSSLSTGAGSSRLRANKQNGSKNERYISFSRIF
jgi:hypothetical protein